MTTPPVRSHTTPTMLPQFLYGSPYYPEHWDAGIREADPELFRAAGWNTIRMAEFAWDLMEPEEGRFDFALFDETIERFAAVGIRTILCTPTATPPRWLTARYPEVLRVDAEGRPLCHGSRQHASHFSTVFRAHSRRITAAMADHFAGNPHVIGWQTDNEMHCHFSEDHHPDAVTAFADFLRERHGDIAALNCAWGTAFWAQTYDSFDDIVTPRPGRPTYLNPAHVLDYRRFLSHGATIFQREQVELLRKANPRWWITHNGTFRLIDYSHTFTRDLDFLSFDSYPSFDQNPDNRRYSHAFNIDSVRALSGNVVIMEQQSGPGGQGDFLNDTPEPGEMRLLSWVNVARGADGVLLFRERSCRFGAEEYWCGVLDHDNVPRRRYAEAARLGEEFSRIGPELLGTRVEVNVGVATGDFDSMFGHEPITHGLPSPRNMAETVHAAFNRLGYRVGCVHPADSLEGLKVYVVPHLTITPEDWIPEWDAWVRAGGVLIVGARTGTKDVNGNVVAETLPGVLRPLVGATVEEYGRQNRPDKRPLPLRFGDAEETVSTRLWYEMLAPDAGTKVLASWQGRHLTDSAAITSRRHGKGCVLYVGTYLTAEVMDALIAELRRMRLCGAPENTPPEVEQVVRTDGKRRFRFVINHSDAEVRVPVPCSGRDLITETDVTDAITLVPTGVAVIREQGPGA